jgi:hypothetical protein
MAISVQIHYDYQEAKQNVKIHAILIMYEKSLCSEGHKIRVSLLTNDLYITFRL